jgi:hypothetical protein
MMQTFHESMSIYLQPMSQSWLHNSFTAFNLRSQPMYVWDKIFINLGEMRSDNSAQQNSAKSG